MYFIDLYDVHWIPSDIHNRDYYHSNEYFMDKLGILLLLSIFFLIVIKGALTHILGCEMKLYKPVTSEHFRLVRKPCTFTPLLCLSCILHVL